MLLNICSVIINWFLWKLTSFWLFFSFEQRPLPPCPRSSCAWWFSCHWPLLCWLTWVWKFIDLWIFRWLAFWKSAASFSFCHTNTTTLLRFPFYPHTGLEITPHLSYTIIKSNNAPYSEFAYRDGSSFFFKFFFLWPPNVFLTFQVFFQSKTAVVLRSLQEYFKCNMEPSMAEHGSVLRQLSDGFVLTFCILFFSLGNLGLLWQPPLTWIHDARL